MSYSRTARRSRPLPEDVRKLIARRAPGASVSLWSTTVVRLTFGDLVTIGYGSGALAAAEKAVRQLEEAQR